MNCTGEQLFPGTRFPEYQYRDIPLRQHLGLRLERLHARITGNDVVECRIYRGFDVGKMAEC